MARANTKSNKKKAHKKSVGSKTRFDVSSSDRIVRAIASRHALGEEKPSRKIVMGLAVFTSKGSFNTTIANIKKKKNHVDYDRDSIWLTEEGREYIGTDALAVPQDNSGIQEKMREEMIKGIKPRQMFDVMTDGLWYSRAELAAAMNIPNNASFKTYMSSLSKVVERDNGKIRLLDMAFPCGRP